MQPHHDHEGWRIAYRHHTALGGPGYVRAYGWGWLSTPGVGLVIAATAALMFGGLRPWAWPMLGSGVALVIAGIVLNGVSERRSMQRVMARCLDVEIRPLLRPSRSRPRGYMVRALMQFNWDGRLIESTPGRFGYEAFSAAASAERFAQSLKGTSTALLVDPAHPARTYFAELPKAR